MKLMLEAADLPLLLYTTHVAALHRLGMIAYTFKKKNRHKIDISLLVLHQPAGKGMQGGTGNALFLLLNTLADS